MAVVDAAWGEGVDADILAGIISRQVAGQPQMPALVTE